MNTPDRNRFVHQVSSYLANTENTDANAALQVTLSLLATGIASLVMDKGGMRTTGFGHTFEQKRVLVLFCDYLVLREGHYLKYTTPAGIVRTFLVNSFVDEQDMGRLWIATCTEVPDPSEGQGT